MARMQMQEITEIVWGTEIRKLQLRWEECVQIDLRNAE